MMCSVMLFAIKNPEEGLWLYDQPCVKIVRSPCPLKLILLALKEISFRTSSVLQRIHSYRCTLYYHSLQSKDYDGIAGSAKNIPLISLKEITAVVSHCWKTQCTVRAGRGILHHFEI